MDYEPLINLQFDSNLYYIPVNTYSEIPFTFSKGKALMCEGLEELPDGLELDLENNKIKGIVKNDFELEFSILCYNNVSVTNTAQIRIETSGIINIFR